MERLQQSISAAVVAAPMDPPAKWQQQQHRQQQPLLGLCVRFLVCMYIDSLLFVFFLGFDLNHGPYSSRRIAACVMIVVHPRELSIG